MGKFAGVWSLKKLMKRLRQNSPPPTPLLLKSPSMIANGFTVWCGRLGLAVALLSLTAKMGCGQIPAGGAAEPVAIDFARDVRPLLSDRCFACHGPDEAERQADLRLDDWEDLIREREALPAVLPGQPSRSEVVRRITSHDASLRMPPDDAGPPLSPQQIQTLINWIQQGALWQQHWAYERPRLRPLPAPAEAQALQAEHWIDRYIAQPLAVQLARSSREGTAVVDNPPSGFAPQADLITLARRLSFDLTGLPPALEEIERLQTDSSGAAIDNYIDRLLASPAYGERLASYWLDLVRYADTVGYHGDQDHNISLYRDYVIDAFNDNLSFDRFTLEQLAGDLLSQPTDEQIIATGYNRLLQTSHEGGVQAKEYLAMYAADRVRNLSAVWLGATVGCAQCHDHKFDPYTAHDFYALAAFFADIDEEEHLRRGADSVPTQRAPEKNFLDRRQRLEQQRLQQRLAELTGSPAATEADPSDRQQQLTRLQEQLEQLSGAARRTMITVAIEPRTVRFLPRGNWQDDSGEIVSPRIPEFLHSLYPLRAEESLTDRAAVRPTRLDLARWLVDAEQGLGLLTARVQVNRLWMLMFGQGLSRSLEDFGGQGEPPSHPELLDRLAIEFVRSGWDVKYILREIARSRTYRQSSLETPWHQLHDPTNRLLSHQHRFRLPAEMIRDAALACSELLVAQQGGASVRPYQPEDYYRHLNFPPRKYQPSTDHGQWRRGVYMHWQRQFLHPMLAAFDAPRREECTAQRAPSNTPLASLVWLNDPSFVEAARALALVSLQAAASDQQRIKSLFRAATSRAPDAEETAVLERLLAQARQAYADHPQQASQLLAVGLWQPAIDVEPSEWAAWTSLARAVLNLSETYTRN